jgi:hypothetical protein
MNDILTVIIMSRIEQFIENQQQSNISFINNILYIEDQTHDGIHYTFTNNVFHCYDLICISNKLNINRNDIIHLHISLSLELNIGAHLFDNTRYSDFNFQLKSVHLTNTKVIENDAFKSCRLLEFVECSNKINTIDMLAFEYCSNLTKVAGLSKLNNIGIYAFNYCESLESLTELYDLVLIDAYAFAYCLSLQTLTGLLNLTTIDTCAFYHCRSLIILEGSINLTIIGKEAFKYCDSLTTLELKSDSSITFDDNCFDESCITNIIFDEITDDKIDEFNTLYPYINISRSYYILK